MTGAAARVTVYPLPAEIRSNHFTVTIDGKPAPVAHAASGYYFVNFELTGSARIAVTAESANYWAKGVEVQPWRTHFACRVATPGDAKWRHRLNAGGKRGGTGIQRVWTYRRRYPCSNRSRSRNPRS